MAHRPAQNFVCNWLPMISWMALIFWLSGQPRIPHLGQEVGLSDDLVAYAAHALMFGVLALLVWRALRDPSHTALGPTLHWLSVSTVLLCALYAATDEVHQLSTPGRTASVSDWVADLFGILISVALLSWWAKRRVPE